MLLRPAGVHRQIPSTANRSGPREVRALAPVEPCRSIRGI